MNAPISGRVSPPQAERPVQQVKPAQNKRAEMPDPQNQQLRASQEAKAESSRNADKGRHVDRYA
jgi:hypothetical protein